MTNESQNLKSGILEHIVESYPDDQFTIADGLDDAIIGVDINDLRLIYSQRKVMDILIGRDGMDEEEAHEYFMYNIHSAYVGDRTRGLKVHQIKQKVLDWIGITHKEVQDVLLANAAAIVLDWAYKKNICTQELADTIVERLPLGDKVASAVYNIAGNVENN